MFKGLFGKIKENDYNIKPRAIAFVDYEHWYISLDRMYESARPDIKGWYSDLSKDFDVRAIYFFADFSNPSIRQEIPRIREVSSLVIETQNASSHHKKDYTDFIMLDHIYQQAMEADGIETFIIFSGDGHFSSAASFLSVKLGKTVGVYGVKNALSNQLRNSATWAKEISGRSERKTELFRMILTNIKAVSDSSKSKKGPRLTRGKTVSNVARFNRTSAKDVDRALSDLISAGYINEIKEKQGEKTVPVLNINWDKIKSARLLD